MLRRLEIPVFLILFGLLVVWPTLLLGIFGDTWIVIWNGKVNFGTIWAWTQWNTYMNPYGAIHLLVYFLVKLVGYNHTAFYLVSAIFRSITGLTFYWFLSKSGIRRLHACLASMLFLASPIGLETTDWVFQMPSYLSMIAMLVGLATISNMKSMRSVWMFIGCFFLSISLNPIRGHGIAPLLWTMLLVQIFVDAKARKLLAMCLVATASIFLFMSKTQVFGDPGPTYAMVQPGIHYIQNSFIQKNPIAIFNLLSNISNVWVPNIVIEASADLSLTKMLLGHIHPSLDVLILAGVGAFLVGLRSKKLLAVNFLLVLLVNKYLFMFPGIVNKAQILVGFLSIELLILMILESLVAHNWPRLKVAVLCLSLAGLFVIVPWIHTPETILFSLHRYFIYSALAVPLLLANRRPLGLAVMALTLIVYLTISATAMQLMLHQHNNSYMVAVWDGLDKYLSKLDFQNKKYVIYFASSDPARLHDSVTYVFDFHAGIRYNVLNQEKVPIPVDNLADFVSMTTDGESSKRYIGKQYVYPRENALAFYIDDSGITKLDTFKLIQQYQKTHVK